MGGVAFSNQELSLMDAEQKLFISTFKQKVELEEKVKAYENGEPMIAASIAASIRNALRDQVKETEYYRNMAENLIEENETLKYHYINAAHDAFGSEQKILTNIDNGVCENQSILLTDVVPTIKETDYHIKQGSNVTRYNFPPKVANEAKKINKARYKTKKAICIVCEINDATDNHHPCGRHRNDLECCILVCKACHILVDNNSRKNNEVQAKWFDIMDWYRDRPFELSYAQA